MEQNPLWEASSARKKSSQMHHYFEFIKRTRRLEFSNYQEWHRWSVEVAQDFWPSLFEFFSPLYEGSLKPTFLNRDFLDYSWFPRVRLNFAENLLRFPLQGLSKDEKEDGNGGVGRSKPSEFSTKVAIHFVHETGLKKNISYFQLLDQVQQLQDFLIPLMGPEGHGEGQVLAAYMPNIPETVISMLGMASLGGIFTSTSSDFGIQGVLDRFGQTEPVVLVAATGYTYQGKYFDQTEKIREIQKQLPSLKKVILVDFLGKFTGTPWVNTVLWSDIVKERNLDSGRLPSIFFHAVPFHFPLYIMYSSGTTGKPKCIVHSVGGTLLQHIKELGLHADVTPDKNLFYFTTCGWMMWNWLVSGLFFGGSITLYEGSPGFPSLSAFMNIINNEKIHIFGTSPKFLKSLEIEMQEASSKNQNQNYLTSYPTLQTILSTGSPLLPEQFDFVYEKIKRDVLLSSICGGTDIIGCFMLGNPLLPVYRGEIQCLGLGMDVAAFNEEGKSVIEKEGELVCRHIFPSMPVGFWGDDVNKTLFRQAYFSRFKGVWHHGDYIRISQRGTVRVSGRSDATLNPGGVRIGTAEIYQQTEKLPYLVDSLCVGKQKSAGEDVEVILFVKMQEGEFLTEERTKEIQKLIRLNTTPRHVPAKIHAIKDIPYTRSGKKMELLISRILNQRPVTNLSAVANPDCLKQYELFIS